MKKNKLVKVFIGSIIALIVVSGSFCYLVISNSNHSNESTNYIIFDK